MRFFNSPKGENREPASGPGPDFSQVDQQKAQELARQNIQTVAGFLGHHRLTDDWYDTVIFRYLLTVQNWLDRPELHRYAFSTIAWRAMSSAVSNERRKQGRRIRAVSLDAPVPGADGITLGDTVTADNRYYIPYQMEAS